MTDFLLELLSEEIPARMQARAREDLARIFADLLSNYGVQAQSIETYSTPRRLALIVRGLPEYASPTTSERKGPRADAPALAIDGFLRSTGLTRDQLVERADAKGNTVLFAVQDKPGEPFVEILNTVMLGLVVDFPWPKSMRWGDGTLRWVRPLQGIVALFGGEVVSFEIEGIASGAATLGHRFHHPDPITIGGVDDYAEKLRACHVILDHGERAAIIRARAHALAAEAGLELIEDEVLVTENAALTEWPVPLLGEFDEAFLYLPPEVITLTMRTNQKYFALKNPPRNGNGGGAEPQRTSPVARPLHHAASRRGPPRRPGEDQSTLAPAFICVANIDAADGGAAITAGNRKVLAARLSDAKFFWEQDLKTPLADHAKKLDQIVFHEKLGTVADKVERVAKLARWLVEEGIVKSSPSKLGEELADLAETAARLCKADLVTQMVGEFPELQGVIGGHYARAQGLDPRIAAAIRDHYRPVGQGDEVPTEPVTVAVALADKLDTLVSFFVVKERPTGSRDPFALRRAALGSIELILANNLRLGLDHVTARGSSALQRQQETGDPEHDQSWIKEHLAAEVYRIVPDFFVDRLKVQQREAGVRHDLVDAVFALDERTDDLVSNLARVRALQVFVETGDGENLLAGYKRAANILKKEGWAASQAMAAYIPQSAHPELVEGSSPTLRQAQGERVLESGGSKKPLSYTAEKEETALIAALNSAEPEATAAIEAEDFAGAMAALASLRAPIDAFFDNVTVNDSDPAKRSARLALLARFRDSVHRVADFSRIEGA